MGSEGGVVTERRIDVGAVTLAIDEAGVGGRPLLLLHGFTGSRSDFDPVIGTLAERGWHVVAPDQRGHGDSDKPDIEELYSIEAFTGDALDLATCLGWDGFVLLGHSFGGMIAQTMALTAPRRVRGLILMDTRHGRLVVDPKGVEGAVRLARADDLQRLVEAERQFPSPLETPAHRRMGATVPGYRERGERNLLACSPAMYASVLLAMTEAEDRLPQLADVRCPALVLVGEQDEPFLGPSERLAETIPGARLAVIPDGGHSPQFEATDAWLAAVLPFLDRISRDPA